MDDYRLRTAAREDCPAILEIYNEAVLTTTATYDYEPRALDQLVEWFELHRRDGFAVVVAVDASDRVVGWGSLSPYHERPGYRFTAENSIYVASTHRGRGLGKRLLEALILAASARGTRAILAAIDASNDASIRLHTAFGFEAVGRFRQVGFKFGRWLDLTYMEKLLPPAAG